MITTLNATLKAGTVAGALAMAASSGMAFDSLRAGFERMLVDEAAAVPAPAVRGEPIDPLIAAIVLPVRDGVWPARALAKDPVADSFARMLQHEPSRHAPPLPATQAADPLIAAVVWPLLRSNHYTVAGALRRVH